MRRVIWSAPARADLAVMDDFFDTFAPDVADRIGRRAIAAGRFLAEHPFAGPAIDDGYRKWLIAGTAYLVIYRIGDDVIEIVRLYHGRENRDPGVR